jgi:hypothetical protein
MRTDRVAFLVSFTGGRIPLMKALCRHLDLDLKGAKAALADLPILLAEQLDPPAGAALVEEFAALGAEVFVTSPEYVQFEKYRDRFAPRDEESTDHWLEADVGPFVVATSATPGVAAERALEVADACDDARPLALLPGVEGALVLSDVVTGVPAPTAWFVEGDALWLVRVITADDSSPEDVVALARVAPTGLHLELGATTFLVDVGDGTHHAIETPPGRVAVGMASIQTEEGEYQVIRLAP